MDPTKTSSWIKHRHGRLNASGLAVMAMLSLLPVSAKKCDGMGERYCETAHKADVECPRPCKLKTCSDNSRAPIKRSGAKRKISDGGTFYWEDLALMGKYEFVYTDDDYICLSACWKSPWAAGCRKWDNYMGSKYCLNLQCRHDHMDRYSGCHADEDGKRKMPWHKPTCKECLRVFPRACEEELKEYVESRGSEGDQSSDKDSSEAEEKSFEAPQQSKEHLELQRLIDARNVESAARKYCYHKYFGDGTGSEGSDASCGSDDNTGSISVCNWMARMEREGHLECSAPSCFTRDTKLVVRRILPWYLQTFEGFCAADRCTDNDTTPHPTAWCSEKATHCFQCQSQWCPPQGHASEWQPVDFNEYLASLEAAARLVESSNFMDRSNCEDPVIQSLTRDQVDGLSWIQD